MTTLRTVFLLFYNLREINLLDSLDRFGELASTARFPLQMHGAFVCQVETSRGH